MLVEPKVLRDVLQSSRMEDWWCLCVGLSRAFLGFGGIPQFSHQYPKSPWHTEWPNQNEEVLKWGERQSPPRSSDRSIPQWGIRVPIVPYPSLATAWYCPTGLILGICCVGNSMPTLTFSEWDLHFWSEIAPLGELEKFSMCCIKNTHYNPILSMSKRN